MPFTMGKKVVLGLAAAGVTAAVVSAASFALFTSAATPQTDTFSSGTVILTNTTPATMNCGVDANNLEAGDSGSCTYDVTYSGTLNAWVGVLVSAHSSGVAPTTPAGSAESYGGEALLNDNNDHNGLQVTISGSTGSLQQSFDLPALSCTTDSGGAESCSGSDSTPILWPGTVTSNTNDAPAGSWAPQETGTLTVNYSLPLASGNAYQDSSATIQLQAVAVQASNNALNSSGAPSLGWNQVPPSSSTSASSTNS